MAESQANSDSASAAGLPSEVPITLVMNKIDLTGQPARASEGTPPRIFLSARTGSGIEDLRAHLKSSAGYREGDAGALAARRRHLDALERARRLAQSAASVLARRDPFELFAEDLRLAQRALGEITGEVTSEELLGAIFGSFCIGK
jgi:tRNA modification GTPase